MFLCQTAVTCSTFDLKRRPMTPFERLSAVRSEVTHTDIALLSLLALVLSSSSAPLTTASDRPEARGNVDVWFSRWPKAEGRLNGRCCSSAQGIDQFVTCDSRQGSGVGIGQQHISFTGLRQVCVTAELLFLGQLEGDRDHTMVSNTTPRVLLKLHDDLPSVRTAQTPNPLHTHLTRLQSSVLILSLSSVMKIMLLLFLFFLLLLSLTSESPTVMTPSSTVLTLMLPLECCSVEVQELGESGGSSLPGGL